jgi:molecular chaperone GrpE
MSDRTEESDEVGGEQPQAAEATPGLEGEAGVEAETGSARPAVDGGSAAELQALRDRYMRLAAEYDNYRKRTERERAESWTKAQGQLVQQILDPLDDLQRVAHFSADSTSLQVLLDGVQMVERKLLRTLEGAGLEVLDASGQPFDPAIHEAIVTASADSHEDDDTVGQVFQQGYRFKGDLLRPARVQVRKHGQ